MIVSAKSHCDVALDDEKTAVLYCYKHESHEKNIFFKHLDKKMLTLWNLLKWTFSGLLFFKNSDEIPWKYWWIPHGQSLSHLFLHLPNNRRYISLMWFEYSIRDLVLTLGKLNKHDYEEAWTFIILIWRRLVPLGHISLTKIIIVFSWFGAESWHIQNQATKKKNLDICDYIYIVWESKHKLNRTEQESQKYDWKENVWTDLRYNNYNFRLWPCILHDLHYCTTSMMTS